MWRTAAVKASGTEYGASAPNATTITTTTSTSASSSSNNNNRSAVSAATPSSSTAARPMIVAPVTTTTKRHPPPLSFSSLTRPRIPLGKSTAAATAVPPPSALTLHLTQLVDQALKQKTNSVDASGKTKTRRRRQHQLHQPQRPRSTSSSKGGLAPSLPTKTALTLPYRTTAVTALVQQQRAHGTTEDGNHRRNANVVDIFGTTVASGLDGLANLPVVAEKQKPVSKNRMTIAHSVANKNRKRKACWTDLARAQAPTTSISTTAFPTATTGATTSSTDSVSQTTAHRSSNDHHHRCHRISLDDRADETAACRGRECRNDNPDTKRSKHDKLSPNTDPVPLHPTTMTTTASLRPPVVQAWNELVCLDSTTDGTVGTTLPMTTDKVTHHGVVFGTCLPTHSLASTKQRLATRQRYRGSTTTAAAADIRCGPTNDGEGVVNMETTTAAVVLLLSGESPDMATLDRPPKEPFDTSTQSATFDKASFLDNTAKVPTSLRIAPNAALQPLLRPTNTESSTTRRSTNSHSRGSAGNFVRLNLRNKAGSCRGARNVKTKTKAQLKWQERRESLNQLASVTTTTSTAFVALSNAGLDAVDDYIDGVFVVPTTTTPADPNKISSSTQRRSRIKTASSSSIPLCSGHQQPCKLLTVKKTGSNKGRKFYACPCPRGEQCHHFVWADDTVKAAQEALLKNKSISGFIARQVASYITQVKCLTIPELKELARRHKLETTGKKAELLMRLSIWVRDEVAKGTRGLESATANKDEMVETSTKTSQSVSVDESEKDSLCASNESDTESCSSSSSSSSTDDELELTGNGSGSWSQRLQRFSHTDTVDPILSHGDVQMGDDRSDSDTKKGSRRESRKTKNDSVLFVTLRKLFGFTSFRNGQEWAVNRCLNQMSSLLVAPTGFGKSLCFALPAAMLDGVCIVVSPLLSLIQDQMQLLPARLPAVTLSGPISSAAMASTLDDIIRGRIKVIFVSPERLTSASFRRLFRPKWNPETHSYDRLFPVVSLLCVDEAHCLSQWAHNFRPSYLRLRSVMDLIQPQSILAITATAGPRVVNDICQLLQIVPSTVDLPNGCDCNPLIDASVGVHVSKTDRDNIDVKCIFLDTQEERLSKLLAILSKAKLDVRKGKGDRHCDLDGCLASGSVIVYVWRQVDAEVVAENLQSVGVAGGIVVYHGGMDASSRARAQSKFMRGKARICVATIAFGLGINKADVAGVIHLYLSSSPEHYIQEIGRAGRNGEPAQAVALVLKDEVLLRHSLAHSDLISRSQVKSVLSLVQGLVSETLKSIPLNRSKEHPVNIALPIATSVVACDCKVETIETIISLLEQRNEKESLLVVEGISYDRASVSPRRVCLKDLAQKEIIAQAVLHCANMSEPLDRIEKPKAPSFSTSSIVNHSSSSSQDFGSYAISVAKCSNCLGESAEPRHVFAALRRLETCGEIDYKLDTSPQNRVFSIRLTNAGMDVFNVDNDSSFDVLVEETMGRFISSLSSSANKVIDVNHILQSVSQVSHVASESTDKSDSLTLFQSQIGMYFEAEGKGGALVDVSDYPAFYDGFSLREIATDAQIILALLQDVHGGIQGTRLVSLVDPSSTDYTALMITKFLHGLAPASVPLGTIRQHHLFGKMQSVRFCALHVIVSGLFQISSNK